MSFYTEFHADSPEQAREVITKSFDLPDCVKSFLTVALEAMNGCNSALYVKAQGHLEKPHEKQLHFGSSTCELIVRPIVKASTILAASNEEAGAATTARAASQIGPSSY